MESAPLLSLLHLCDSLFPIGSFAHSDGLEAATADRTVTSLADLRDWMDVCLDESLARADGPALALAWEAASATDRAAILALDAELNALRPAAAGRQASRAMGSRLLRTWCDIHPRHQLGWLLDGGEPPSTLVTLPVAFGSVAAAEGIDLRAALQGFFYARLAAVASAAMRLVTVGQHHAHALLAASLERVPAVVDGVLARNERPAAFTPAWDISSMNQQYVHSRLFRS